MVYESELIKMGELKVGEIHRKELLDFYAKDYNCMLVIPDSPVNIFINDSISNYKVKDIIDNCSVAMGNSLTHYYCNSIIILEKVQ